MTAEAWPTEDAATKAVDAAARKAYEVDVAPHRKVFPPSVIFSEWDDLPREDQLDYREQVLPFVWAALEALPDPRRSAWTEGHQRGMEDEIMHKRLVSNWTPVNPYPES